MHGILAVGRSSEVQHQWTGAERRCAKVGFSRSMPEGNRPTKDHVSVQLAVDEAGLQTVKQARSSAWRVARGSGEV